MVARLVSDAVWRNRWVYLFYGGIQLPLWLVLGNLSEPLSIDMTSFSLIGAAMLGPFFATAAMALREVRHLPVTARDVWRTTWTVATVVSAGIMLTTKTTSVLLMTAFGGTPQMSFEAILLSAVYDFTWAGALLATFPLLGYVGHVFARRGALAASLTGTGSIVTMLASVGLPILTTGALPTRMSEFTPATVGLLIAGLAVAFGVIAWTPTRGVLAGERTRTGRGLVVPGAPTRPRYADRLTGISRVAVPYMLGMVALAIGPFLALAAYGVISGSGPWWFVPHTPSLFDPQDTGERGLTYFVTLPSMVGVGLAMWTPWARMLKVLPLSTKQINALLVITPFATWTILWVLGWSAYVLAYGTPQILRIEFVFGMAAIAALVHAVLLRVQGGAGIVWVMIVLGALLSTVVEVGLREEISNQIIFAVISASALSAAVVINHRTLTRSTSSSRPYQPPRPPFGAPSVPGIR